MIKIENNTALDYSTIGIYIDKWNYNSIGDIINIHKTEYFAFMVGLQNYKCTIYKQKTGLKFVFEEVR